MLPFDTTEKRGERREGSHVVLKWSVESIGFNGNLKKKKKVVDAIEFLLTN